MVSCLTLRSHLAQVSFGSKCTFVSLETWGSWNTINTIHTNLSRISNASRKSPFTRGTWWALFSLTSLISFRSHWALISFLTFWPSRSIRTFIVDRVGQKSFTSSFRVYFQILDSFVFEV